MVLCGSVSDVVGAVAHARVTGDRVVPRGGGHCFAGRSSRAGVVLDMSGLSDISVADDGIATIGAGALLGQVYPALHAHGRTLPAGCGPTVGIAGLTLGGGIGLLGRSHGLTCDRLIGAQVVLASGDVVDTDHEPDLLWALRGAGGGQFGVVTSLRFATVPEPVTTRIQADLPVDLVGAWQEWAPDAPDWLTVNLTLVSEPGVPVRAVLFGAATRDEHTTRELLRDLTGHPVEVRGGLPVHELKTSFDDLPAVEGRSRSEFFTRPLSDRTLAALLHGLGGQLSFTAMGGAYNRVAPDATAFAHRDTCFLLEHVGDAAWADRSWATAHAEGSGRVYPNFPDPALDDWAAAYHGGNHDRLVAIKRAYDPHRFFDFPQAI